MLYEDLLRIPLIMSLPGGSSTPERRTDLAEQVDIAPTVAAIAKIEPSAYWNGISLIEPAQSHDQRTIFSMNYEQSRSWTALATGSVAALQGPWKLVRFFGQPRYPHIPALTTQLFDLGSDPAEAHNVASAHPQEVTSLSSQIDAMLGRYGGPLNEQDRAVRN
jgi:arylsulfatase A-like enzyme